MRLRTTGVSAVDARWNAEARVYTFYILIRGHHMVFRVSKEELEEVEKEQDGSD